MSGCATRRSESLSQFMYASPRSAKRLHLDAIPRAADDYLSNAGRLATQPPEEQPSNPAWHIHGGDVAAMGKSPVSFVMLLNLASVVNADNADMLWGFLRRYAPGVSEADSPYLARLIVHAVAYYQDFVRPTKRYRAPTEAERAALADLAETLRSVDPASDAEAIQFIVYEVGKRHPLPDLKSWFGCLYQVLLGQEEGPRFGGFAALYGLQETIALIDLALARPAVAA